MFAAVSPYHLTTREPPAMAALLLAERAVTFMPSPRGTREDIEHAATQSPEYLRFIETWAWSMPLWQQGVITSALDDGDDAMGDMLTAWRLLGDDHRYAPLRPLARTGLFETQGEFLDAISRDLLRGGPDPGISLPLAAGIDRFAVRRGLVVMRSAPTSIAQKAEQHLGKRAFAVSLPILLQASAERLIEVRGLLADELECWAQAVNAIAESFGTPGDPDPALSPDPALVRDVELAARALAHAFEHHRPFITSGGRDEVHVIDRVATITGIVLPVDAVLRSGVSAMRSISNRRPNGAPTTVAVQTLPVVADTLGSSRVLSLVVKPLGARRA